MPEINWSLSLTIAIGLLLAAALGRNPRATP